MTRTELRNELVEEAVLWLGDQAAPFVDLRVMPLVQKYAQAEVKKITRLNGIGEHVARHELAPQYGRA